MNRHSSIFLILFTSSINVIAQPTETWRCKASADATHITIEYEHDNEMFKNHFKHNIPVKDAIIEHRQRNYLLNGASIVEEPTLDLMLLDSLIFAECNDYRSSLGIKPISWDSNMSRGANHHSYYQMFFHELTHEELLQIPDRKNEQELYYRHNDCSEIILFGFISANTSTYFQAALKLLKTWQNSPGHDGILKGEYTVGAFGTVALLDEQNYFNRDSVLKYNSELVKLIDANFNWAWEKLESGQGFANHILVYSTGQIGHAIDPEDAADFTELNETWVKSTTPISNQLKNSMRKWNTLTEAERIKLKDGIKQTRRRNHRKRRKSLRKYLAASYRYNGIE